jgi:hypothetical protein
MAHPGRPPLKGVHNGAERIAVVNDLDLANGLRFAVQIDDILRIGSKNKPV